ncbi:mucoidy inhibitor MuiA family protein [Ralstonia sp.]|uniref:mucoidy inhibitor MuiA family protein n=1 Tax=Ralstonia sp. TaxID=54061 RepID=UPI002D1B1244|nr:mucoidy inhibitor MuiA family protein [Ralstonia sp.]HWV04585.1 mucoidy inhibitor MuiA family protein [Ralstonia sp.]
MKTKPAAAARFQHRQRVACTALGAIASAAAVTAQAATPSRITDVTLYPDSATVVRTATVAAGARSVELTCLPMTFDADSLRVESDSSIRVGDVRVESIPSEGSGCARTALDTQIRTLEDQRAALGVQIQANALSASYLKAVSERTGGDGRAPATDFSTLGRATDALARNAQDVFTRQEQLKKRDAELKAQLDALQRAHGSASSTLRTVRIAVAAPRGGELRVSYQTSRAGWRPAYQASVDSVRSNVVVERQATLAQSTGEDWRGVHLRLSTGHPRNTPRGPEPYAWQLDIQPPQAMPYPAAPAAAMAPAPKARFGRNNEQREADGESLFEVNAVQTAFATEFDVPGAAELPSDAQKVTLTLASETLPAKLAARSTPRLDTSAYLVATVDRPEGIWPAGNMQLRRDGAVVGSTQWNPAGEDQKVTLPFGRDDLVNVVVETPKTFQRSVGLLDNRNERQLAALYTVRNRHRDAIDVQILEATPVSQSDDIKVRSTFSPEPAKRNWERRPGVIAWEQTIPAGESARFSADYQITYPKDARITGLR